MEAKLHKNMKKRGFMRKENSVQKEKLLAKCMTDLLFSVNQLHLTHWLTLKNHHHVIVGELYKELEEELDELAEQYLGACLPEIKPEEALNMDQVVTTPRYFKIIKTEAEILSIIQDTTMCATTALNVIEECKKFSFMRDTLMDIIAILHSKKYQITQE